MIMVNKEKKSIWTSLSFITAVVSLGFAIATMQLTSLYKTNKCSFDTEQTTIEIKKYKGIDNTSLLAEALISEAEGDYLKCMYNSGILLSPNKKKESIEKYNLALSKFDSLKQENLSLNEEIDKLTIKLSQAKEAILDELGSESQPGSGTKYLEYKKQAEEYEYQINMIKETHKEFQILYTDNLVRIKGKIVEIE